MQKKNIIISTFFSICSFSACTSFSSPVPPTMQGVWGPQWSPVGDLIAFQCVFIPSFQYQQSKSIGIDDMDILFFHSSDVCIVDQNGNNFRRLTSSGDTINLAWSPDGKMLAWSTCDSNTTCYSISTWNSQNEEYVEVPLQNNGHTYRLKWSTDGHWLFFGEGTSLDIAKREVHYVPPLETECEETLGFEWSSNGEYLAFGCYLDFNLKNFPESKTLVVTKDNIPVFARDDLDWAGAYKWSPVGNTLAWIGYSVPKELRVPGQYYENRLFFTYFPTGKTFEYKLKNGFSTGDKIFWSQDGSKIVHITILDVLHFEILNFSGRENDFPPSIESTYFEIENSKLNGHGLDRITWSPDNKHIIISSDFSLWIIDIDRPQEIRPFSIDYP